MLAQVLVLVWVRVWERVWEWVGAYQVGALASWLAQAGWLGMLEFPPRKGAGRPYPAEREQHHKRDDSQGIAYVFCSHTAVHGMMMKKLFSLVIMFNTVLFNTVLHTLMKGIYPMGLVV